jgi:3-oxoadipate enol-lactonase
VYVTADDGARIYVEAAPDNGKPPLLFSNSLGTNLHMWDAQMAPFSEHFRIIRHDSRGHGRSDAPKGPYSIDRLGRDTVSVLNGVGVKKAYFCGLSKGGMIGQWLGANAPDRVERLVLCNTAAHMPGEDLWNTRIEIVTKAGMGPLAEGVVERWLTKPFREANPGEAARIVAMLLATPPLGYAASCAAVRDMDQRESNKTIKAPTLIVAGDKDPATPPERGQQIHEQVAGSKIVVLNASHLSNIEATKAFNQVVLDFLTR